MRDLEVLIRLEDDQVGYAYTYDSEGEGRALCCQDRFDVEPFTSIVGDEHLELVAEARQVIYDFEEDEDSDGDDADLIAVNYIRDFWCHERYDTLPEVHLFATHALAYAYMVENNVDWVIYELGTATEE